MISIHWVRRRKTYWDRLEQLIGRADGGLGKLSRSELRELGLLYRQIASDLSVVQEDASSAQLAGYLNQLLARSHNLIYHGHRAKASGLVNFYRDTYPRVFRETLPLTAAAALLFLITGLAGWAVTMRDPGFARHLLGPQMMETIDRREMWTHSIVSVKPLAASAITTNNLTVAFTVFALGITVFGTIWMTAFNGLMLGVVGAATWRTGMALQLWSFVAPHGVLELPAICIAAGAGLRLREGCCFQGSCRGAPLWQKPGDGRRGCCWGRFRCC